MGSIKVLALALIVAGILALAYGGFTYTKGTHTTSSARRDVGEGQGARERAGVGRLRGGRRGRADAGLPQRS